MEVRYVYVVTAGSYSDYHIEAVFDTEVAAQAYVDNLTHRDGSPVRDAGIEPFSLNSTTPTACTYYSATVCDDPTERREGVHPDRTNDWETTRAQMSPNAWYWTPQQRLSPNGAYYGSAVALDPDLAMKIAHDAMYQFKAEHQGIG